MRIGLSALLAQAAPPPTTAPGGVTVRKQFSITLTGEACGRDTRGQAPQSRRDSNQPRCHQRSYGSLGVRVLNTVEVDRTV